MSAARAGPPGDARDRLALAALLLLVSPVFFWKLGNYSLVTGDEAFFQTAAARMAYTGDWLKIVHDDRELTFVLSSPLHFWARAILIAIGGDNGWTMRLLSATFGWLSVGATFVLARRALPRAESVLAALFLATTYRFVWLHGARTGEADAIVTFLFLWIVLEFLRGLRTGSFLRHHLALVVLLNVKLPLVLVPMLFEGAYLLATAEGRERLRGWLVPLSIALPVGLAWHVYSLLRDTPGFVWVLREMMDRATGEQVLPGGPIHYAHVLFTGQFPVSLAALAALFLPPRGGDESVRRFHRIVRLVLLGIFGFFSVVRKSFPWYMHPAYPFLAILAAEWIGRSIREPGRLRSRLLAAAILVAAAVLRVDPARENPFEGRSFLVLPVRLELDPGALLLAGAVVAVLVAAGMARSGALRRALPVACAAVLVILGVTRILSPWPYLDYRSPAARVHEQLETKRRLGATLHFPVDVSFARRYEQRYYFAREYDVVYEERHRRDGTPVRRAYLDRLLSEPRYGPRGPR